MIPPGSVPARVIVAVGGPTVVITKLSGCPVSAVADVADVNWGGCPTVSVNACVLLPTALVAVNVIG